MSPSDRLDRLNGLDPADAVEQLLTCCASQGWAQRVADGRPYPDADALLDAGDTAFAGLTPDDVRVAVDAHPRIGDRRAARRDAWSEQEQAGVATDSRDELAELNERYEARFGHVFLICATGLSADQIATAMRRRIDADSDAEWAEVTAELGKIVRLRLTKLVAAA